MSDRTRAKPSWVAVALNFSAGQSQALANEGDWIILDSFYGSGTALVVRDQDSVGVQMRPGDTLKGEFQSLLISCATAASLVLLIGYGEPPQRQYEHPRGGLQSLADVSCGAGALTQVVTGSITQKRVHVSLAENAPGSVRVGGNLSAVAATSGVRLQPGATLSLETSSDIYVYNTNGSAATISVTRETQV